MSDPTNLPAWGSAPAVPAGTLYVVVGFYAANGQRFCTSVTTSTPREAEEWVMHEYAGEGDLRVCGVFAILNGRVAAVDTYAFYLDPDQPEPSS